MRLLLGRQPTDSFLAISIKSCRHRDDLHRQTACGVEPSNSFDGACGRRSIVSAGTKPALEVSRSTICRLASAGDDRSAKPRYGHNLNLLKITWPRRRAKGVMIAPTVVDTMIATVSCGTFTSSSTVMLLCWLTVAKEHVVHLGDRERPGPGRIGRHGRTGARNRAE